MKKLGNITDVTKQLSAEIIDRFNLSLKDEDDKKWLKREIFNTLQSLRSHTYDHEKRTVEIRVTWSADDVLEVNSDLNADQVAGVLDLLKKHHDANIGITWEVIEATIDTYLRQQ